MKTFPALFLCGFGLAASAFGQTPGSVDATFSAAADQTEEWILQAAQADGKVLVAALARCCGEHSSDGTIARLNPDGSYDHSFVPRGISFHRTHDSVADGPITALAPEGKILVGMQHGSIGLSDGTETALVRLNSDGSLDPSFRYRASEFFPGDNKIISVLDGSVLVEQVRIKPNGSVDDGFHPKFTGCGRIEAWQPDGRILLICGVSGDSVGRFLADGTPDPEFHPPTTGGGYITGVQALDDKGILLRGPFRTVNRVKRSRLARLKSDGRLDESFMPTAQITVGGRTFSWETVEEVRSAVVQSDGKIVVNVIFASAEPTPDWLVRLNSDGSLDPSFTFVPTLCCPLDQVDLGTYSVASLFYHPDGSLWITTASNEILRLHGDLPVIRLSVPSLSILENKVEVRIRSDAADGRRIVLEAASSLAEGGWQPIATNTLSNGSITFNVGLIDTAKSAQSFYRALLR